MKWVKRNLYFLIGSLVALALIGAGGYYLWSQMNAESELAAEIEKQYQDIMDLLGKKPQPGKPGSTNDNVQAAKDQAAVVNEWVGQVRPRFQRIPQVANTGGSFPNQLDEAVAELHREADQAGVQVAKNYYFTFQAEQKLLSLPPGSVPPLARHLSEIKAICKVLFDARINSLTSIQREVASPYDTNGPDYLPPDIRTISTALADLTPYQVSFDCFSGELADVLGGLAASPHGFVVAQIEVEPATPTVGYAGATGAVPPPGSFRGGGRGAAPGAKPVTLVKENRLRVDLLIEVVKLR